MEQKNQYYKWLIVFMITATPAVGLALPQEATNSPPPVEFLTRCRSLPDNTARLDCYDQAMTTFENAQASGSIVVLSQDVVQENQRQSFGFGLNFWSRNEQKAQVPEIQSVSSTLAAARQVSGSRRWLITLTDGSVWLQVDTSTPYIPRANNQPVTIRRGALGSYRMTVAGNSAFSVRRQAPE